MFALIRRLRLALGTHETNNERTDDPHGALVDALKCELAFQDYMARAFVRRHD
jgi:hypothetical protein